MSECVFVIVQLPLSPNSLLRFMEKSLFPDLSAKLNTGVRKRERETKRKKRERKRLERKRTDFYYWKMVEKECKR